MRRLKHSVSLTIHNYGYLTKLSVLYTEANVKSFMGYYRMSFPDALSPQTSKLHMLEDHVLPWLEEWHCGFGLMGEQGAESRMAIPLEHTRDPVKRFNSLMREHLIHIVPQHINAKHPPIKRKKKMLTNFFISF